MLTMAVAVLEVLGQIHTPHGQLQHLLGQVVITRAVAVATAQTLLEQLL